jgi:hypothetical protein
MARLISTTVRLEREDVLALNRARADGLSADGPIHKGLRLVASRYYSGRRPPAARYECELPLPSDLARALELDAKFGELDLGLVDGTVPQSPSAARFTAS